MGLGASSGAPPGDVRGAAIRAGLMLAGDKAANRANFVSIGNLAKRIVELAERRKAERDIQAARRRGSMGIGKEGGR